MLIQNVFWAQALCWTNHDPNANSLQKTESTSISASSLAPRFLMLKGKEVIIPIDGSAKTIAHGLISMPQVWASFRESLTGFTKSKPFNDITYPSQISIGSSIKCVIF